MVFLKHAISLVSELGVRQVLPLIAGNVFAIDHCYILTVNLESVRLAGKTRLKYKLRRAGDGDFERIKGKLPGLSSLDRKEIATRLIFHQYGAKDCYVAELENGELVYFQWLVYATENEVIAKHYPGRFYPLKQKEAMVENAFTFPRYRGMGLLPSVTSDLLQMARESGYESAITYIRKGKISPLNEFVHLGFKIRKMVREYKILGCTRRML